MNVTQASSAADKIRLFRALFRGRDDVYARRFESRKTGKSGYQPACGNEWVRGVCDKPRIKCSECHQQRFLPVGDEMLRWHLSGIDDRGNSFVAGVYPMLRDETCWFLAMDLDGDGWRGDAATVMATCRDKGIPAAVERSRSGDGAHIWIFFEQPVPARLARDLGSFLLTAAMEARPEVGFDSYDRLFPNQDTLPRGGLGNLIALPLQFEARKHGNSVFLDENLEPYADQWNHLSAICRLTRPALEELVRGAHRSGSVLGVQVVECDEEAGAAPWERPPSRRWSPGRVTGPVPESVEMVLSDEVYFARSALTPALQNRILRLAAFQNPEFYKAQAMRLPTYGIPRVIHCGEIAGEYLGIPRGCREDAEALLDSIGVKVRTRDERAPGAPISAVFRGVLRPDQAVAAEAMLRHDTGVLAATTAFGKTVVAAWLVARRGVSTLVLVHRQALLEQWVERLATFLDLPPEAIGRIGGGKRRATGLVDVALIQSLSRKGVVDDVVAGYGHVVVDECHHLSAHSFELVARRSKARFVTGLSATVARKDGHHPIVLMQCGPVRHRVDARGQAAERPFKHHVIVRPTGFRYIAEPDPDVRVAFQRLYGSVAGDGARNELVVGDVVACLEEGRSPLVLTERTEHLDELARRLSATKAQIVTMQGGMGRKALAAARTRIASDSQGRPLVILATGRYVGEGFDDPRLDTLFLTLPISWRGTIAQYAGRLHRLHEGKREVRIYDYADLDVPMLARMFDRRCQGYEAIGYEVLLPASAVPGWPPEVPLPIDPEWKREYAASVRRLVRDGIDAQLANLFVNAARTPSADDVGAQRARSASEAFLYRRLQSIPGTAGKFRLNHRLPIPFAGNGWMEVDFIFEEAAVVVELDGAQHLADAGAYRRDREKDAALQEHGYRVLRFLAEDLGPRLDAILDAILRTLSSRTQPPC